MLTTLLGTKAATPPGPMEDYWYMPIGREAAAGIKVTAESAAGLNVLMACIRIIAEELASYPLIIYRDRADGGKDRAKDHPMYATLKRRPNEWQTRFEFVEMMQGHVMLRGNAFAEIVPVGSGRADLIPLNPDRMKVEQLSNGRLRYIFRHADNRDILFNQDEILHVRGMSFNGLLGLDPIDLGADSIGTALAGERYAGRFFKNDATPSGVLQHPGKLGQNARKYLEGSFDNYSGENAHRPRVLEEGMQWQRIGINAEEAQLIEARKFSIEEIARMFRVPLHLIQSLDKATFSNIEQQSIDFVVNTMRPWAIRWEQALERDVIDDDDEFFVEFLIDSQLRADTLTRYQVYQIGISSTFLSPNEARLKENMNPREGGDVFENPNTTSGDLRDDEDDESFGNDDQPEGRQQAGSNTAWINIVLADVVDRCTKAETREIEKRIGHANSDREKFNSWLDEFYAKHSEYMRKAISGFGDALDSSGKKLHYDIVIEDYIKYSKADLSGCTEATFPEWAVGRPELLTETIKGAIA